MTRSSTWLNYRLCSKRVSRVRGMVEILFSSYYQKQKRTRNGFEVLTQHRTPSRTVAFLDVPKQFLVCPESHREYLFDAITNLNLNLNVNPEYLNQVAYHVTSLVLELTSCPLSRNGYYMGVEIDYWHIEMVGEGRDVLERQIANLDSVLLFDILDLGSTGGGTGASKKVIQKLIKKGGFVTGRSNKKLGTCSVCLEELSSSAGTELLRTDCSHVYHQACLLLWLKKQTTCPICRQQVAK